MSHKYIKQHKRDTGSMLSVRSTSATKSSVHPDSETTQAVERDDSIDLYQGRSDSFPAGAQRQGNHRSDLESGHAYNVEISLLTTSGLGGTRGAAFSSSAPERVSC